MSHKPGLHETLNPLPEGLEIMVPMGTEQLPFRKSENVKEHVALRYIVLPRIRLSTYHSLLTHTYFSSWVGIYLYAPTSKYLYKAGEFLLSPLADRIAIVQKVLRALLAALSQEERVCILSCWEM